MKIGSLTDALPKFNINNTEKNDGAKFNNILTDFIGQVNQAQIDSNKITEEFVNGGNVELHEVMIAGEKAKTSLELLLEIRNKTIDMYKEITRMQ